MAEQKGMSILQKLESAKATEIAVIPEVADRFKHLYSVMHRQNGEIRYEAEKFHFMKALSDKTELQQCTKLSLYGCFLDAAVNGLSFDPGAGHLYVVSFSANVGTRQDPKWEKRASLMISGKGELLMRQKQGQIRYADNPVLVYEGDFFKYGTDRTGFFIEHEAVVPRKSDTIIACYIRIERPDGSNDYKVMTNEDIQKLRAFSKDPNSLAWTKGLAGMIQAKVIKHAFRTYPRIQFGDFSALASNEVEKEEANAPKIDYGISGIMTSQEIHQAAASGVIKEVAIQSTQQEINAPADDSFTENNNPEVVATVTHNGDEF